MNGRSRAAVCCWTLIVAMLLALGLPAPTHADSTIRYVRAGAGGANNGASWADAYTSLQDALAVATSGDQIWVAAGRYTPSASGDRAASFTLPSGVSIYGGFAGDEMTLDQRDWTAHASMLSGDLNGNDGPTFAGTSENSYRVVRCAESATLDGFTISGGNADGSYPNDYGAGITCFASSTLRNLIVSGNRAVSEGGGMVINGASPTLTNVTISDNVSLSRGGGIANSGGSPVLTDVTISGNSALSANQDARGGAFFSLGGGANPVFTNVVVSGNLADEGGGFYFNIGSAVYTNVTISGNRANTVGGGISNGFAALQLRNSIIWGNAAGTGGGQIAAPNGGVTVSFSSVEGGASGTGNLSSDPQFVTSVAATSAPSTGGDLRLQASSPAIDAGNNEVTNPSLPAADRDGLARRVDRADVTDTGSGTAPLVDMGAYEKEAAVNEQPTLDQPADRVILEDAGVQAVALAGLGAGVGDAWQKLTITAESSNPALVPAPAVSYTEGEATGDLTFTPVGDASGSATITVTVRDSGGTAGGGADTLTRTFTVQVTPVNDAPDFTPGSDQVAVAGSGAQSVAAWATGFSPGPPDEAGQTLLSYTVVGNYAPELFSVAPAIDSTGSLTYTPEDGAGGTAMISVAVRDNGGTANGGADTSVLRTFTITITSSYRVYLPVTSGG